MPEGQVYVYVPAWGRGDWFPVDASGRPVGVPQGSVYGLPAGQAVDRLENYPGQILTSSGEWVPVQSAAGLDAVRVAGEAVVARQSFGQQVAQAEAYSGSVRQREQGATFVEAKPGPVEGTEAYLAPLRPVSGPVSLFGEPIYTGGTQYRADYSGVVTNPDFKGATVAYSPPAAGMTYFSTSSGTLGLVTGASAVVGGVAYSVKETGVVESFAPNFALDNRLVSTVPFAQRFTEVFGANPFLNVREKAELKQFNVEFLGEQPKYYSKGFMEQVAVSKAVEKQTFGKEFAGWSNSSGVMSFEEGGQSHVSTAIVTLPSLEKFTVMQDVPNVTFTRVETPVQQPLLLQETSNYLRDVQERVYGGGTVTPNEAVLYANLQGKNAPTFLLGVNRAEEMQKSYEVEMKARAQYEYAFPLTSFIGREFVNLRTNTVIGDYQVFKGPITAGLAGLATPPKGSEGFEVSFARAAAGGNPLGVMETTFAGGQYLGVALAEGKQFSQVSEPYKNPFAEQQAQGATVVLALYPTMLVAGGVAPNLLGKFGTGAASVLPYAKYSMPALLGAGSTAALGAPGVLGGKTSFGSYAGSVLGAGVGVGSWGLVDSLKYGEVRSGRVLASGEPEIVYKGVYFEGEKTATPLIGRYEGKTVLGTPKEFFFKGAVTDLSLLETQFARQAVKGGQTIQGFEYLGKTRELGNIATVYDLKGKQLPLQEVQIHGLTPKETKAVTDFLRYDFFQQNPVKRVGGNILDPLGRGRIEVYGSTNIEILSGGKYQTLVRPIGDVADVIGRSAKNINAFAKTALQKRLSLAGSDLIVKQAPGGYALELTRGKTVVQKIDVHPAYGDVPSAYQPRSIALDLPTQLSRTMGDVRGMRGGESLTRAFASSAGVKEVSPSKYLGYSFGEMKIGKTAPVTPIRAAGQGFGGVKPPARFMPTLEVGPEAIRMKDLVKREFLAGAVFESEHGSWLNRIPVLGSRRVARLARAQELSAEIIAGIPSPKSSVKSVVVGGLSYGAVKPLVIGISPSLSKSSGFSGSGRARSVSPSVSKSFSASFSVSGSKSVSPSRSLSLSSSRGLSPSPSFSKSLSLSVSPSSSFSPSFSKSLSLSPSASISPSISPSFSPSKSLSPSFNPSSSLSPSFSPSYSFSPSTSPSGSSFPGGGVPFGGGLPGGFAGFDFGRQPRVRKQKRRYTPDITSIILRRTARRAPKGRFGGMFSGAELRPVLR